MTIAHPMDIVSILQYANAQYDILTHSDFYIFCYNSLWCTCRVFVHLFLLHSTYLPLSDRAFDDISIH